MQAKVTTAYGEYEGEVATIAPTATGGSSNSLLDNVGSMAGVSGLSSLTDSGAGVECTIEIKILTKILLQVLMPTLKFKQAHIWRNCCSYRVYHS